MIQTKQHPKPFSDKQIIRLLLALTIILALVAGYFQAARYLENKRYLRLEDMYVRVRDELGREETQRLIDQSYDLDI